MFFQNFFILILMSSSSCLLVKSNFIETDPIVQTTSGLVVGQKLDLADNSPVYRFLGVPYAEPPVGGNRFEKPKEIVNQTETIVMAKQMKPTCVQMRHLFKAISPLLEVDEIHNISEDCLYLNIYVPANSDGSSLPIMVWLPGEGFDYADARQYNGAYLASIGNVIVITVQYRVGVFGFLKENAGIWDQMMALKWINQNAQSFGGNPDSITVFGRFTGSMSISILLASPQIIDSEVPLFNKAILMSGIAVGNWVFDNKHDQKMSQVFENTDCSNIDCLKTLSAERLLEKSGYGWKPFIDSSLIVEEPLDALRRGKFPKYVTSVMLGTNQFEGNLCLLKHLVIDEPFYQKLIKNNVTTSEYEKTIREDLEMFYEDGKHSNNVNGGIVQDRGMYVQFCSELLINSHMKKFDALLQKISEDKTSGLRTIFNYKLDYKPSFSIAPKFINSSIHGDDVILAFGLVFKNVSLSTESDHKISKKMVQLFANFAHTGYPFQSTMEKYLEIRYNSETVTFKITNFQLCMILFTVFILSLAIILIIVAKNCLKREASSQQIKQLAQTYSEFH